MFTALLLLGATHGVPTQPADPIHYRLEISASQEVDRTSIGLERSDGSVSSVAFLTVTMMDTAGGKLAHVVIDSLTIHGTGMMAESFDPTLGMKSKGVWFHLYVVNGAISAPPTPSMRNPATDLCGRVLRILFSTAKAGGGVGARWSDTTTTSSSTENRSSSGTTIESWLITGQHGDTLMAEAASMGRRSVEGQVNGTGLATGKRTMSALTDGTVLNATQQLNEGMLIATGEGAGVVQLKASTAVSVSRVP